jgi:hypothetical protein
LTSGDQGTQFVLTTLRGNGRLPTNTSVRMTWNDLVAQLRASRRNPSKNKSPEHPHLDVISFDAGSNQQRATSAARTAGSTFAGMSDNDHTKLTADEMDWLNGLQPADPWDSATHSAIVAAADEATLNLIARGPQWLREDVDDDERYIGIAVGAASANEPATAGGYAMPYSVMIDIHLPSDYPQRIVRPGWAVIDGWFVLDIHTTDATGRPALITVMSLQDAVSARADDGAENVVVEARLAHVSFVNDRPRATLA